jgi:hypothetical protein
MTSKRVAKVLGLSEGEAGLLLGRAQHRLGRRGVSVRQVAFLLATAPVLRRLLPRRLRESAIRPLVYALVPGPTENLLYARVFRQRAAGEPPGGSA